MTHTIDWWSVVLGAALVAFAVFAAFMWKIWP